MGLLGILVRRDQFITLLGLREMQLPLNQIVRVVAKCLAGGFPAGNFRFVLVCGLDERRRIAEGEWMGYTHNNDEYFPFLLQKEPLPCLFLGGEEKYFEPTTIFHELIEVGSTFTVSNSPNSNEQWSAKYAITSVHILR